MIDEEDQLALKKAQKRARRVARREWENEKTKQWRRNNKDKVLEYKRKAYQKNHDIIRAYQKEYYRKNAEKMKQQTRDRRVKNREIILAKEKAKRHQNPAFFRERNRIHKERNPNAWRLYSTRKQAKQKGIAFDLDIEWFNERISAGVCEMSGLPFDLTEKPTVGGRGPNSPSVDRKNPKGPYTKDNCRLILWWLNRAMIDLGEDYCINVFRGIFLQRGEMMQYEDRQAA